MFCPVLDGDRIERPSSNRKGEGRKAVRLSPSRCSSEPEEAVDASVVDFFHERLKAGSDGEHSHAP